MKKILFFILFYQFSAITVYSQNLTVAYNGTNVSNGEVTISGIPSAEYIKVVLNITNNAATPIDIKVRRNVRENLEGTLNLFCLGNCYDPSVNESPVAFTLASGATTGNDDFYMQFFPEGQTGTAKIVYDIFNANDINDMVTVTLNFNIAATGIQQVTGNPMLSISGMPSSSGVVTANFNFPRYSSTNKLLVTNILGVKLIEIPVSDKTGRVDVPTQLLPRGIYICSLQSDGRNVVAKKFVVN
jgi:hypothetical protein